MKLDKRQVICVSLGIILALAVTFVEKQDTVLTKGNGLERNTYGQGETQQEILVEGLLAKKVPLAVRIGERRYTKEQAADAIHMAAEELSAQIAGGNESLEQVQSRLELVTWLDKYGISVRWQPDDTELISASGEVFNSGCPESGRETFLTATLKAGEYAEDYIYRVNVLPPGRTQEEKELAAFENFLMEKEEEQKYSEVFILPEEFEGKTLTYSADRISMSSSQGINPLCLMAPIPVPAMPKYSRWYVSQISRKSSRIERISCCRRLRITGS